MSEIPEPTGIARPPTKGEVFFDLFFRRTTFVIAWFVILLVALIVFGIAWNAKGAAEKFKFDPLTEQRWGAKDAEGNTHYGILPEIWGTIYSSVLGVGIGALFGVAVAIFLTQDFIPNRIEIFIKNVVELLAAIPSVVYGLWGIFVVIPAIRPSAQWLNEHVGWIPFFGGTGLSGPGILPSAIVLAIMVLPTISAISRDSLAAVPPKLREAAFGLGATRWEAIFGVILPTASRGIYGSIILAFGRALGETMALAMLAGGTQTSFDSWSSTLSVFAPANTLAALIANRFPEADDNARGVLMYAALVLLAITLVVNVIGTIIVQRSTPKLLGGR
jgi:phosphate transport system permease protein